MQNAARPHDVVYLGAILIPILSILKRKELDVEREREHTTYISKTISQNIESALQNSESAFDVLSDRFHLNAP